MAEESGIVLYRAVAIHDHIRDVLVISVERALEGCS